MKMVKKIQTYVFASVLLAFFLCIVFFPYLFLQKTFLPVDLFHMLYKPFASQGGAFHPFNHFEDDILRWYYEWKFYSQKYLYQPYWSPNIFGGIPWYANTYASHFSPTNWILKLGTLEKMYPLELIAQLWIAGIGMFLLLQYLRVSFGVSILFSTSYMLSSIFITLLMRWWILGAFCWVPFFMWALHKFFHKYEIRYFAVSSLFLAFSFMGGFIQSSAFILVLFGCFTLSQWLWGDDKKSLFAVLGWSGAIFIFAVALSAVMWIPTMEYFLLDIAKGESRAEGGVFGKNFIQRILSIPFLISFLVPQILGTVRTLDLAKMINTHLQDFSAYIGSIPLLFAISGVCMKEAWQNKWKPYIVILFAGIIIPIFTPLDKFFYFRFLIVYVVGACVLGALAMERYLSEQETGQESSKQFLNIQKIFYMGFFLLFLVVCIWNFIFYYKGEFFFQKLYQYIQANINLSTIGSRNPEWMLSRVQKTFDHFSLSSLTMLFPFALGLGGAICLYLFYKKSLSRKYFLSLITFYTLVELTFFARGWLPINDINQYPFFPTNEITEFLVQNSGPYRTFVDDFNGSEEIKQKQILPSNVPIIYGYKSLEGFDGLSPAVVYHINARKSYRRLGLLNVKYIITNGNKKIQSKDLRLIKDGPVAIYENILAKPRATIVYQYKILPERETLELLSTEAFTGDTVYFSHEPEIKISSGGAPEERVKILKENDNSILYEIENEKDGYFVSSETYYPGWKATLDGFTVNIQRANYAMRALIVPKGKHVLQFDFDPESYHLGLKISLAALILFLLMLSADFFKKTSIIKK